MIKFIYATNDHDAFSYNSKKLKHKQFAKIPFVKQINPQNTIVIVKYFPFPTHDLTGVYKYCFLPGADFSKPEPTVAAALAGAPKNPSVSIGVSGTIKSLMPLPNFCKLAVTGSGEYCCLFIFSRSIGVNGAAIPVRFGGPGRLE